MPGYAGSGSWGAGGMLTFSTVRTVVLSYCENSKPLAEKQNLTQLASCPWDPVPLPLLQSPTSAYPPWALESTCECEWVSFLCDSASILPLL